MTRPAFSMRQRRRLSQHTLPHRPTVNWGSGELPAPWAAGDIVQVSPGAAALERMHGDGPGLYVVDTAFSIDDGDAWHFRVDNGTGHGSGRLHVARPWPFSTWDKPVDYMAGVTLVDTLDPVGLDRRARMIADGWALARTGTACSRCNGTGLSHDYREEVANR